MFTHVSSCSRLPGHAFGSSTSASGGHVSLTISYNHFVGDEFDNELHGTGGNDSIEGLGGNDTLLGDWGNDTLDGGDGIDTAVYVAATAGVTVNLVTGVSRGGDGNDSLIAIENLWGSYYNDTLIGDAGANLLKGLSGSDSILGGDGNDTLWGGSGNESDTLNGGAGFDAVSYSGYYQLNVNLATGQVTGGAGNDTLISIEVVTAGASDDTLTGNNNANILDGGWGNDSLDGAGGNDTLYGGKGQDTAHGGNGNDAIYTGKGNDVLDGGAGSDTMSGGTGSDLYYVNMTSDVVMESSSSSGGFDVVVSTVSYILPDYVEELDLSGTALSATGNGWGNVLVGTESANRLYGLGGDDSLVGAGGNDTLAGGEGNDTLDGGADSDAMTGGTGDDTYRVDSLGDTVTEAAGGGTDTVEAWISIDLLGRNLENIVLRGYGSLNATGNATGNYITGNEGNNAIDGGAGADTMVGGTGDDSYFVDSKSDVVLEYSGGGGDAVWSSISYTLPDYVENLVLQGAATVGTGNAWNNTLMGNALDNRLYGNDGDDQLEGSDGNDLLVAGAGNDILWGDGGADTLNGGTGDDYYHIDESDTLIEGTGGGTDTVEAYFSFTLANNFETLILTGSANIDGTGNTMANSLVGNDGNNVLSAGAGTDFLNGGGGDDTLTGGTGVDRFWFGPGSGDDTITDFQTIDRISLYTNFFDNGAGVLAATTDVGGNAVIDLGDGNSVTLVGVLKASLTAGSFEVQAIPLGSIT
nr:calcium-binding protein [Caenimonas aquaedulcis]